MSLLYPKPTKRDRPNLKRKREIRAADRAFQAAAGRCIVPGCGRKAGRHHRVKRRHSEYRHDRRFAMDLCWEPHHREIECIGEGAFREKYGIELRPLPDRFR